jgi:hypothetical protein
MDTIGCRESELRRGNLRGDAPEGFLGSLRLRQRKKLKRSLIQEELLRWRLQQNIHILTTGKSREDNGHLRLVSPTVASRGDDILR